VTATFRVDPPRGGGQLRCLRLYGAMARSIDVEIVCLVDPLHPAGQTALGPGITQTLVPRSPAHTTIGDELSNAARMPVTDIVAATDIWATPAYLAELRRAAHGASAVLLAEPYLLPAVEQAGLELPFLYDAFNVEAELKAAALPHNRLGRELLAAVIDVEQRAVAGAAVTTACSIEDADALATRYGRSRADIVVIPNGTDTNVAMISQHERAAAAARWRDHFVLNGTDGRRPGHLALFFASWHPPNIDAAELVISIAPDLPDVLFLLAGSHGEAFRSRVVPRNVVFSGVVADRAKAALLGCVDVALNPMRTGSGTNLKLIEYLASGVPAVSTPFGVRGLDAINGVHLLIATPDRFASAIRTAVEDPAAAHVRAIAGRSLAADFYDWADLGDRLTAVVGDVVSGRHRAPVPAAQWIGSP
ncbi:MAG: glycosyltransferase family 4 protein, partial [Actinomycetota bacterium]|nr:glycosyltransferase family 4 protein [Actinomycetota bacterium]